MNKTTCLKRAKLFLKMAECDFALIKIIKLSKMLLTAALLVNSAAFAGLLMLGVKRKDILN